MGDFKVHQVRFFHFIPSAVHCMCYEKTLRKLAVSRSDGTIEIWNLNENWLQEKVLAPSQGRSVEALLWCGERLFSAGLHGNVHEHDLVTGAVKKTVSSNSGPIWSMAMNGNGTQIAAGTENGCVVLFDIRDMDIQYSRALDKQEGRIISLAWHHEDNLIVTGGIDNLRVWSVDSGHAIQRLSLGRQERNKETIVWAVAITKCFTIISGDSRGKTCFWNGRQGTLLKSFQAHRADVFTLCVDEAGTKVVSSGTDPTLVQFEYITTAPNSELRTWVRSLVRMPHSHDVRAVTFAEDRVVSGGVDGRIVCSPHDVKTEDDNPRTVHMPALPQAPLVYTAKTSNMALFRHFDTLELWKLGSTSEKNASSGEFMKLDTRPVKLLELKSKDEEYITCAAVSHDGQWIAYADQHRLRLFQVSIEETTDIGMGYPRVSLSRVRLLPSGVKAPKFMVYSPDGSMLFCATSEGTVQVIRLDPIQPELVHTLAPPKKDGPGYISCLAVSPSGKYLASADVGRHVHIYNIKRHKHVVTLPMYAHIPTAIGFHPKLALLAVAYSDQKVLEYDITSCEYTEWTRKHMHQFPHDLEGRSHKIRQVLYNPSNPEQILIRDVKCFCIIDKTQPFPDQSTNTLTRRNKGSVPHAFHSCNKFKFLLHLDLLEDDYMLAVERTPVALLDALPPTLKSKKFGT